MTARELFEAIGLVEDELILAADGPSVRKAPIRWHRVLPAAACLCLFAGGIWTWAGLFTAGSGSSAPAVEESANEYRVESSAAVTQDAPMMASEEGSDCWPVLLDPGELGLQADAFITQLTLEPDEEFTLTLEPGGLLVLTGSGDLTGGAVLEAEFTAGAEIQAGYAPLRDGLAADPVVLYGGSSGSCEAAVPAEEGPSCFWVAATGESAVTVTGRIRQE